MNHEALPGGLSAVIIWNMRRLAREAPVGWGARAVMLSQAVRAKWLTYSVV